MLIELNNIARRKDGKEIVQGLSWRINEGEKWMLYGLNGAGKTTLLNILNAYEPNTSGEMTLFGMQPGKKGYSAANILFYGSALRGLLRGRPSRPPMLFFREL